VALLQPRLHKEIHKTALGGKQHSVACEEYRENALGFCWRKLKRRTGIQRFSDWTGGRCGYVETNLKRNKTQKYALIF